MFLSLLCTTAFDFISSDLEPYGRERGSSVAEELLRSG
jgi:hypothetical protein